MLQMLLLPRGHSFKTEKPYVPEVASDVGLRVAAVALGWALGFGEPSPSSLKGRVTVTPFADLLLFVLRLIHDVARHEAESAPCQSYFLPFGLLGSSRMLKTMLNTDRLRMRSYAGPRSSSA